MGYGPVYVLGVAAGNTSEEAVWDVFKIYASIEFGRFKTNAKFQCCLRYELDNGTQFVQTSPKYVRKHKFACKLRAFHFTCPNIWHDSRVVPNAVGLTIDGLSCKHRDIIYTSPFYPLKQPGTRLVIGTKMAFGNMSAELIIEWMECHKYLGVDKVVTYYTKDIDQPALNVLKYYESTGILDLYYFEPAASDIHPRIFHPPNAQKWNDQRMVIYDSFERNSGYTYFGIIDHDEFLIPSRNRSLKEMLDNLYGKFKKAAGFTFSTQFYYLSWGKSGRTNDLILSTYVNRTDLSPHLNAPKNIYKPNLVSPGGVSTHEIEPDYAMYMEEAPAEEGYIRHFRECRPQLRRMCMNKYKRVTDFEMADWSLRIQDKVRDVRQRIFGKQTSLV